MGEVYRARDERLGREVAVKVLPEHLAENAEALGRFEREAKAVAALSHPNILAIHDVGREGGFSFAVMELLEGETLRERLTASALPPSKAIDYAQQIARGLAAAHDRGIVHRDLKPENLFLTREGLVKILDFGLARQESGPLSSASDTRSPTSGGTAAGMILGTIGYMSPEQVRGKPVDYRSDLFSLGAILFEMLTGRRAFQRDTAIETMMAILQDDPPLGSASGRTLPAELQNIVAHCLEKSPEERFQSARDLAFALQVADRDTGVSRVMGSGATRSPEVPEASIAVLPFRNMSADKEAEYFSDGMTEEIINALTKIAALRVAARTSSFAFKGKDTDVRQIGRELGVRSVLEGSVRQAGRRIRITAQLIDVANGYHLWSERYDREMEDVFAVQDEISHALAETLRVRLLPAEAAEVSERGTEDVEAYNDYLKGRYFFNRREPPEAIAEFERAIRRDPEYAAAYTGLADSYCIFGFYGGIDTRDALARARTAAEKALELAPDSAGTHVSLALVEHYFGWDLEKEERELRRAIALAPRSAAPHAWLGLLLGLEQRLEEALTCTRRAAELEPLSANVQTNVGWNYSNSRRFDDAIREFRRALHIDPNAPYPLWAIGINYQFMGEHVRAVESLEKAVEVTRRRQTFYLAMLGGAYAAAGRRADALKLRSELEGRAAQGEYIAPFHLAFLNIPLGEYDEAFSNLERGCAERNGLFWWIRISTVYDPLRGDPRFARLLKKIVPA
jgi:serine/threonine-protein kinase